MISTTDLTNIIATKRKPKYLEEQPDFGGSESLSQPGDH